MSYKDSRDGLEEKQRVRQLQTFPKTTGGIVADDEVRSARYAFVKDLRDDTNVSVGIGCDDHGRVDVRHP